MHATLDLGVILQIRQTLELLLRFLYRMTPSEIAID
jgi:hypothetical protein